MAAVSAGRRSGGRPFGPLGMASQHEARHRPLVHETSGPHTSTRRPPPAARRLKTAPSHKDSGSVSSAAAGQIAGVSPPQYENAHTLLCGERAVPGAGGPLRWRPEATGPGRRRWRRGGGGGGGGGGGQARVSSRGTIAGGQGSYMDRHVPPPPPPPLPPDHRRSYRLRLRRRRRRRLGSESRARVRRSSGPRARRW